MKSVTFLLFFVLSTAVFGGEHEKKNRSSVFVIGDSISIQYGPELERIISKSIDYGRLSDPPYGPNGEDSRNVGNFLFQSAFPDPTFSPSVLMLNCGLHDIKRERVNQTYQVPLNAYRENLIAIRDECERRDLPVIWVTTTMVIDERHNSQADFDRFDVDVQAYNRVADEIWRPYATAIIDLYSFSANPPNGDVDSIYTDHVHFIISERERQASFIAGYLLALFG